MNSALKPFMDSSSIASSQESLQTRFRDQGYLFFKQLLPKKALSSLHDQIRLLLAHEKWISPENDLLTPQRIPVVEGEEAYLALYDKIQRLPSFHSLAHAQELIKLMNFLHGGESFPHPLGIARLVFPNNEQWSTPAHQDYPNNQGTKELFACWIPLTDCPLARGSLSVLPGSHHYGVFPLEFSLGAGHRRAILDERLSKLEWVGGDFELGDVLIFHSLTLHKALPNLSPEMRLSVDYRYQKEGDALTSGCLQPHFSRQSWETIYSGWEDKSLCYYWQKKKFQTVNWSEDYHRLSAQDEAQAIKIRLKYDRMRERLQQK